MSDVETAAKEMGWVPKENFRGPPEKWIDAEAFVERGEQIMPILKANNHRLTDELATVRSELAETRTMLTAATESIEALKEFNNKSTLKAAKESRTELAEALKEAREKGDVNRELEISDQLAVTTEAIREAEKPVEKKPVQTSQPSPDDPAWKAFLTENPWYGTDKLKSNFAIAVAKTMREEGSPLKGKAFLDKMAEQVEAAFPNPARRMNGKAEGGNPTGGGGGSSDRKSYADLPADAKAACDNDAKRLVGKGRAFADLAAWRSHYVKQYFEE